MQDEIRVIVRAVKSGLQHGHCSKKLLLVLVCCCKPACAAACHVTYCTCLWLIKSNSSSVATCLYWPSNCGANKTNKTAGHEVLPSWPRVDEQPQDAYQALAAVCCPQDAVDHRPAIGLRIWVCQFILDLLFAQIRLHIRGGSSAVRPSAPRGRLHAWASCMHFHYLQRALARSQPAKQRSSA